MRLNCRLYKYLSVFLVATVMLASFVMYSSAETEPVHMTSSEEDFKILIIADTQDNDNPNEAMLNLVNASLDSSTPDLVVLLGDNIYGPHVGNDREKAETAIRAVVDPIAERNIPFTLVFGNHDDQECISKEEQLEIYRSYSNCLTTTVPDIPGCGNSYILIGGEDGNAPAVLWFLDSGTYSTNGIGKYGFVTEEQNAWMLDTYNDLCSEYGADLTSYVFQHIPVPQVFDFLEPVSFGTNGAIHSYLNPFSSWYLQNDLIWEGSFGETPCASEYDSGEFAMWKECNVKAAFFGHDHVNDYCGTLDGIDIIATSGAGFLSYGRGDEHGARIVVIDSENPENYSTEMIYYRDIVDAPLPDKIVATIGIEIRDYIIMGVCVIVLIIAAVTACIILIRKRKKHG